MGFIINESAMTSSVVVNKKHENSIEFIAILQEANKANRNGRLYKKEILENALNSPYIRERLATKSLYSEAGHPADNSVQRQMTIDQRNIACIIEEIWWEGDLLKAKCETANTAVGRDMMGLIEQGSKVAFSLRAQGNVHQDPMSGLTVVDAPVQICTYDWVVNPSHAVAYLQSVCEDTREAMLYGNRFNSHEMALCESTNIFENGELINVDAAPTVVTEDYTKKYNVEFKKLSEMYIPKSGDKLKSIDAKETIIENDAEKKVKKVLTEDFLVKDIRSKIAGIEKGGE